MVPCWLIVSQSRQYYQWLPVILVVFAPIIKLLPNSGANLDYKVWGDCDISIIEQLMHIRTQKQAIRYVVGASFRVGLNMRCF